MLMVVLGIGASFMALGFLLNENNSKYLLSGYNTMSTSEQAKFPLSKFLVAFKRFHIWLGGLFIVGALAIERIEPDWLGYHLAFTPIVGYLGFFVRHRSFSSQLNSTNKRMTYVGIGILGCTLVGMIFMFRWSEQPNTIEFDEYELVIDGPYGLEIHYNEIASVQYLDSLPEFPKRLHGIATGKASKGKFQDASGKKYLLLIDHPAREFVQITLKHGLPIIVSLQETENDWPNQLLIRIDRN